MKTTRPLERIYLAVLPIKTEVDGTVFNFLALDDFSKYVIGLDTIKVLDTLTITEQVAHLTKHQDFKNAYNNLPFTLVLPFDKDPNLDTHLQEALKPFDHTIIYDQQLVFENIKPVLESFNDSMS